MEPTGQDSTYWPVVIFVLSIAVVYLYHRLSEEENKRKKLAKENAPIATENALLEAEQLKFQLQPHTSIIFWPI